MEYKPEEHEHPKAGKKAIISAVAWVNRGHAKAVLEEFQPDEETMKKTKKMGKKLGVDPTKGELSDVKDKIEAAQKVVEEVDMEA
jgi:periodic tryptophan protein 1